MRSVSAEEIRRTRSSGPRRGSPFVHLPTVGRQARASASASQRRTRQATPARRPGGSGRRGRRALLLVATGQGALVRVGRRVLVAGASAGPFVRVDNAALRKGEQFAAF